MSHPVLITLTMPRSGTTLLHTRAEAVLGDAVRSIHEPIQHAARLRHLFRCFDEARQERALADPAIGAFVEEVARSAEERPVAIFGNVLSHLAPVFVRVLGDRVRLLHLHRDPVETAASIWVKSKPEWWDVPAYEDDPFGVRIAPDDPHARFVEYGDRWATMSRFERILYQWLERQAYGAEAIDRYPDLPSLSLRSEDLFADVPGVFGRIAGLVGLEPSGVGGPERPGRRNRAWDRVLEERPLGEAWRAYVDHERVLDLARTLGHPVDPERIERAMERYQRPPGIGAWIRNRTGWWAIRRRLAAGLRGRGLLPARSEDAAGLPPRSTVDAIREVARTVLGRREGS